MESIVGLPNFSGPYTEEDHLSNQESHFQEHFASQIVLRRLLVDFHSALNQGEFPSLKSYRGQFPNTIPPFRPCGIVNTRPHASPL